MERDGLFFSDSHFGVEGSAKIPIYHIPPMQSNLSTHMFIASCDPLLVWNMLSTFQCATLMSQSYESTRVCMPQMTYKIGEFRSKTA